MLTSFFSTLQCPFFHRNAFSNPVFLNISYKLLSRRDGNKSKMEETSQIIWLVAHRVNDFSVTIARFASYKSQQ